MQIDCHLSDTYLYPYEDLCNSFNFHNGDGSESREAEAGA
jgi:hypothetical protein